MIRHSIQVTSIELDSHLFNLSSEKLKLNIRVTLIHQDNTQLISWKPDFFATNADHTGNVGQFSMGNEPCLHIPYLYNYAGEPWRTQYRIRHLMNQWFRNDVMGIPGDEDGGGMSAFRNH